MSLAARCPHCTTLFRLSAEHLSAASGWVRCGVCTQIFDASAHLCSEQGAPLDLPQLDAPDATGPTSGWAETSAEEVQPGLPTTALQPLPDIDLELPDLGPEPAPPLEESAAADSASAESSAAIAHAPEPQESSTTPPDAAPAPLPAPQDSTPGESEGRGLQNIQEEQGRPGRPEDVGSAVPRDLRGDLAASAPSASATQSPAPAESGRRPTVGEWSLGLVLSALLLLMVAVLARGAIAQAWPPARPILSQLCQSLGCQMPAVRSLQGLDLQAMSLSLSDEDGLHRLRLTLLNTSDTPLLPPALNLELLDGESKVMERRRIAPEELELQEGSVPPQGSADAVIKLNLKTLDASVISSFRLEPQLP